MNMDYNLYKIFIYLYEEKSISKVAKSLYVSQPAISYSLKELESKLGNNLFIRNNKGIEPTKETDKLYKYIKTAFNIINTGEKSLKDDLIDSTDIIKIGAPSHISSFCICPLISQFKKVYKNVKFEIFTKPTSNLVKMLETREIDIILDILPIKLNLSSSTIIYLKKLHNCFAYSKKNNKDYSIKELIDLKKYPLILPSIDAPSLNDLNKYLADNNVEIEGSIYCWTTESIVELVREGVGVGYFFEDFILNMSDKDDFEIITFNNKLPSLKLAIVFNNELLTPILKKFIDLTEEKYKN